MMTKNTKMLIGVGLVGVAGYLIWKQMSKPKTAGFSGGVRGPRTMNAAGATKVSTLASGLAAAPGCPCQKLAADQSEAAPGWEICAGLGPDGKPDKMCRKIKQR